ncbi:hypothetical protein LFL96_36850 (plasmid) [Paraburkholderia sp. D15]|uniref:hypothetical protein n=1 Tax=Paraburkholderia sp. D15 TaxID=2880218 RepID=UPI002478D908|nr:hypothetical protein [Paraburkholderia sp. D15]WGS55048.1 hypothetical protein LFL96_36850 [Paraburkholderia sp. D15]
MTYSCSDFASDVQNCLVACGALPAKALSAGDIGDQADACIAAVVSLNCAAASARFSRELIDSEETLSGITEQFGKEGLATLFYLQAAILRGSHIELNYRDMDLAKFVNALPSGSEWMTHVCIYPGLRI